MADNIVVGALPEAATNTPTRYKLPLSFDATSKQVSVNVSIGVDSFVLFFNSNELSSDNVYMSCYTLDKSVVYFAGYKCVFGNYINQIDNGSPYKFYFLDQSNGQNYSKNSMPITYEALNNGVTLYAELN